MATKKQFSTLLIAILFMALYSNSSAQTYTGGLYISTQAQLNTFNYTEVTGYLNIYGSDITDLSPLQNLTTVGGDFYINTTNLTNIDDLSNLTSVGGLIYIGGNPLLLNLDGLSGLTSVVGNFSIYGNPVLADLNGLINLTTIGGNLQTVDNDSLKSFDGLNNLTSVGGYLSVIDHATLTSLEALSNLTTVGNFLSMYDNAVLTTLDGIDNLTSVGGFLRLVTNPAMENFCALYTLLSTNGLGGYYLVSGNAANPTDQDIINGGACGVAPIAANDSFNTGNTQNLSGNLLTDNGSGTDDSGDPVAAITSFGGGSLGGSVTDNAAGSSVSFAGGTLTVNADGSFTLSGQSYSLGSFSFEYRLENTAGYSDATASILIEDALGTITGTVYADGNSLAGVKVALLDTSSTAVAGFDTLVTDSNGQYIFEEVEPAIYIITIIEPLGYTATDNPIVDTLNASQTDVVDFILEQEVAGNKSKSAHYWSRQIHKNICGYGRVKESEQDLLSYFDAAQTHYTPHFNFFENDHSLMDWWKKVRIWCNFSQGKRARRQLAALVLNMVSGKIGQYTVVSADGRTAGEVLTYVSQLLSDSDNSNDKLAKKLAKKVNRRRTIPAGLIPASTILYKGNGNKNINWGMDEAAPTEFALGQNYPNPFNPTTNIQFSLPEASSVTLEIFNIMGQRIQVLTNGQLNAGHHTFQWNGTNTSGSKVSSGIYFYHLKAGNFTQVKKMNLMK